MKISALDKSWISTLKYATASTCKYIDCTVQEDFLLRVNLSDFGAFLSSYYEHLVGRPEGKRPLGRPRRWWEDNITMDLREVGIDGANWIQLVQDRFQRRAFVKTVMNLRVP
jgi:hypothetical protein